MYLKRYFLHTPIQIQVVKGQESAALKKAKPISSKMNDELNRDFVFCRRSLLTLQQDLKKPSPKRKKLKELWIAQGQFFTRRKAKGPNKLIWSPGILTLNANWTNKLNFCWLFLTKLPKISKKFTTNLTEKGEEFHFSVSVFRQIHRLSRKFTFLGNEGKLHSGIFYKIFSYLSTIFEFSSLLGAKKV